MNQFLKLRSLKTLLIDDNVIIRDTMQKIFEQKGCLLKACETAEEGLQALAKERFDIIISDLQLPGIDGVEFFKRAMRQHPDTIKILISGYGDETAVARAFKIGVHAFINKPFSLTTFLEKLLPHVAARLEGESPRCETQENKAETAEHNHVRTAGNTGRSSRHTATKHHLSPLTHLYVDSPKIEVFRDSRYFPNQVAV